MVPYIKSLIPIIRVNYVSPKTFRSVWQSGHWISSAMRWWQRKMVSQPSSKPCSALIRAFISPTVVSRLQSRNSSQASGEKVHILTFRHQTLLGQGRYKTQQYVNVYYVCNIANILSWDLCQRFAQVLIFRFSSLISNRGFFMVIQQI